MIMIGLGQERKIVSGLFLSCLAVDDYGMIGENNQSNGRGANEQ